MAKKNSWKFSNETTKYKNVKTEYDGIKFDSKKERDRYIYLKQLQEAGEIDDLRCQEPFTLIQKSGYGRAIKYYADFTYRKDGNRVVEDVKAPISKTPVYRLKKRLMAEIYEIEIQEV